MRITWDLFVYNPSIDNVKSNASPSASPEVVLFQVPRIFLLYCCTNDSLKSARTNAVSMYTSPCSLPLRTEPEIVIVSVSMRELAFGESSCTTGSSSPNPAGTITKNIRNFSEILPALS